MKTILKMSMCWCAFLQISSYASGASIIYFLIQDIEGHQNDSFVLPLRVPEQIDHARRLIAQGPSIGLATPQAKIALGKDWINRNHVAPGKPEWSWHVKEALPFTDGVIPEWSATPTGLESGSGGRYINGELYASFLGYTAVAELGPALELSITPSPTNLIFDWPNLSTNAAYNTQGTNLVYTVESKDSLSSTNWVPVAGFTWPTSTNQVTVPAPVVTSRFYRVKAELGPP